MGATVVGAAVGAGATYAYIGPASTVQSSGHEKLESDLASAKSDLQSAFAQLNAASGRVRTLQAQLQTSNQSTTSLQSQIANYSEIADALTTLNTQEAAVVTAAAATIIPSDSNGPGATEAGVIYFIDRQLNGDYGTNGRMFNQGPFLMPNTKGPLTVDGITYSQGTPNTPWVAGQSYGYPLNLRSFWHSGIAALEAYATSAYGGAFESLSAANQIACLQDLFNNKPTSFNGIRPSDFANELFFMVWSGFLMDPMYGGNRGMVGWVLTASPGLNSGNFYGEGQTPQQRMVASTPSLLKPASLAQFQQAGGVPGVLGGGSTTTSSSTSSASSSSSSSVSGVTSSINSASTQESTTTAQ